MNAATKTPDPLTAATVTVALVIAANKPFYPLYVWWLVGNGIQASFGTLIAAPLFLAILLIARFSSLAARIALPLIGTLDTVFETKLFGQGSGTELFLAPCLLLVAVSFHPREIGWQRAMVAFVFGAFLLTRNHPGPVLHTWSAADLAILLNLNAFSVASLMAFIILRTGRREVTAP